MSIVKSKIPFFAHIEWSIFYMQTYKINMYSPFLYFFSNLNRVFPSWASSLCSISLLIFMAVLRFQYVNFWLLLTRIWQPDSLAHWCIELPTTTKIVSGAPTGRHLDARQRVRGSCRDRKRTVSDNTVFYTRAIKYGSI